MSNVDPAPGPARGRFARITSPDVDSTRTDLLIGLFVQLAIIVIFVNQARQPSSAGAARVIELIAAFIFALGAMRSGWMLRKLRLRTQGQV